MTPRETVTRALRSYLSLAEKLSHPKAPSVMSSGERVLAPDARCYNCGGTEHHYLPGESSRRCVKCHAHWLLVEADSKPRVKGGHVDPHSRVLRQCDFNRVFSLLTEPEWWLVLHREVGFGGRKGGGSFLQLQRRGHMTYPGEKIFKNEKSVLRGYDKLCTYLTRQLSLGDTP